MRCLCCRVAVLLVSMLCCALRQCMRRGCGSGCCVDAWLLTSCRYTTNCQFVRPMFAVEGTLRLSTKGIYFRPSEGEESSTKSPLKAKAARPRFWPKEEIKEVRRCSERAAASGRDRACDRNALAFEC